MSGWMVGGWINEKLMYEYKGKVISNFRRETGGTIWILWEQ